MLKLISDRFRIDIRGKNDIQEKILVKRNIANCAEYKTIVEIVVHNVYSYFRLF